MDTDSDAHFDSVWPWVGCERSLTLQTGGNCRGSVGEGEEERVALCADLHSSMLGERAPKQCPMNRQQFNVRIAKVAEEASRPFDVGHGKSDQPGGQWRG
jgi:hypothetical protein